jgi:hypothetical protein
MRLVLQLISWIALAGTLLPSVLFCTGSLSQETVKVIMLISTVVWFIATPLWMGKKQEI